MQRGGFGEGIHGDRSLESRFWGSTGIRTGQRHQSHCQWPTSPVCTASGPGSLPAWPRQLRMDKLSVCHTHRTHAFTSAWQRGTNRSDFWISESGEFRASCP